MELRGTLGSSGHAMARSYIDESGEKGVWMGTWSGEEAIGE